MDKHRKNKMKQKCILLDVDGVLLNWLEGYTNYKDEIGNALPESHIGALLKNNHHSDIITFHHSDGFSKLNPMKNAVNTLQRLSKTGYTFIAITSCSDEKVIIDNRLINLEQHFPMLEGVIFKELGGSKADTLSKFDPTVFVDDSVTFATEGLNAGHTVALMSASYNINREIPTGITRVFNWLDLEQFIVNSI